MLKRQGHPVSSFMQHLSIQDGEANALVAAREGRGNRQHLPLEPCPTATTDDVLGLLLLLNLLLLLLGSWGLSSTGGGSRGGRARRGSSTRSNVGEEVLDVLALKRLGEEGGPDRLDLNLGGGGEGVDLLGLCE